MKTCYTEIFPGESKPAIADLTPPFGIFAGYTISRINVPSRHRGEGVGKKLLEQICRDADLEGVSLHLCINPTGEMDYDSLEAWYRRYGFVNDPSEDGEGWFIRPPVTKENGSRTE